jgi:hypothetical protein
LSRRSSLRANRQQDRIADRDADGIVDLLEAIEIDHHHRRAHLRVGAWRNKRPRFQRSMNNLRFGNP